MRAGLLAEFETVEPLVEAIGQLRALGYRELDAFAPYPLPEVERALGLKRSPIPRLVLLAGLTGAAVAFFGQWWITDRAYPLNVGAFSTEPFPAFVPATFETTVLFAALAAFVGVLALGGLPRLWAPEDEVEGFESASVDTFWLAISDRDPCFDAEALPELLEPFAPKRVERVEASE